MYISISNKVSSYFNLSAANFFYYSHVYSYLIYGLIIWGGWLSLAKYDSLTKKLNKIICNIFWRFCTPFKCKYCILKKLRLLKLFDIYKLQLMTLMYTSLSSPNKRISSYIQRQPRNIKHNLRTVSEFVVPHFRINQVKFNFEYQALSIWNTVPPLIKQSKSVHIFKRLYTNYLIKTYCAH